MDLGAAAAPAAAGFTFPAATPAPVLPAAPASATEGQQAVLQPLQSSIGMTEPTPAPATLPLPTTLPPAWLAPAVVPAVPVAPPADGPVATIADRCVRLGVPGAEEQPSLYRLCRQWVQNDPDLGEPLAEPLPTSKLPPLPALSEEAAAVVQQQPPQEPPFPGAPDAAGAAGAGAGAAAAAGGSGTPPEVPDLLKHHQQHWKAVRQHAQARAAAAQQRHGQRLQAVLALGGSGVGAGSGALPVPMQH